MLLGAIMVTDLLRFVACPGVLTAIGIGQRAILLTVARMCMRGADPDDQYVPDLRRLLYGWMVGVALTVWTLALGLSAL